MSYLGFAHYGGGAITYLVGDIDLDMTVDSVDLDIGEASEDLSLQWEESNLDILMDESDITMNEQATNLEIDA